MFFEVNHKVITHSRQSTIYGIRELVRSKIIPWQDNVDTH